MSERKRLIRVIQPQELRSVAELYDDLYFKDLRFEPAELRSKLCQYELRAHEDWYADWGTIEIDLSEEYVFASKTFTGRTDARICRREEILFKNIPLTTGRDLEYMLLHEMIHAYELLIPHPLQQYLVLFSYGKLSETLGTTELDRIIRADQHCIAMVHDLLFLLKALALDIAMDLPPGTIIDYGTEEFFHREDEG